MIFNGEKLDYSKTEMELRRKHEEEELRRQEEIDKKAASQLQVNIKKDNLFVLQKLQIVNCNIFYLFITYYCWFSWNY